MSIFGTILDKIFHHAKDAAAPDSSDAAAPAPSATPTATQATAPAPSVAPAGSDAGSMPTQPQVDVEAVLTSLASAKNGSSHWQQSIVDLLKLLDMDSSLSARKELANELNVHAGADGSAEENVALHKAVMKKLAENGGKVPDSLKN